MYINRGIERRIRGPRLRSPPPTSLHSFLSTQCFRFSSEPAIFPYGPPSPSNRHSSRAFIDVVWYVSFCRLYRSSVIRVTLFGEFCVCYVFRSSFFSELMCGVQLWYQRCCTLPPVALIVIPHHISVSDIVADSGVCVLPSPTSRTWSSSSRSFQCGTIAQPQRTCYTPV